MLTEKEIKELVQPIVDGEQLEILGQGAFGIVYKKDDYVIKSINLDLKSDIADFKKEVKIWVEFSSHAEIKKFIPEYLGSILLSSNKGDMPLPPQGGMTNSYVKKVQAYWTKPMYYGFIIQKFEPVTSLGEALANLEEMVPKPLYGYEFGYPLFMNIIEGYKIMHRLGYVHRDIKTFNILVRTGENNKKTFPLIIDFGLVCKSPCEEENNLCTDEPDNSPSGTPYYLANNVLPFSNRLNFKTRHFSVSRNKTTMLNRMRKTFGCSRRSRRVDKTIYVKTHNLKAKGLYNFATDNYALALTLKEIFDYIDWSKHPKQKKDAEDLILSYKKQILPFLAADIATKVAKRSLTKSKINKKWDKIQKRSKFMPKLNAIKENNNNNS